MNDDLTDAYVRLCREQGAIMEVGPERYREFCALSDEEMLEILVQLILGSAKDINRLVFAEPRMVCDQDIVDMMETQLSLLARGYIALSEDGGVGCTAPEGPAPTEQELAAIDSRIRSAFSLVRPAVFKALGADPPPGSSRE